MRVVNDFQRLSMKWKYLSVGLLRRYAPKQVLFWVMHYRSDGSLAEQAPQSCLDTWSQLLRKHRADFIGKTVLEVGSGRCALFGLQLLAAGADRVTLIDPYAVSLSNPVHCGLLRQECIKLGLGYGAAVSRIEQIRANIVDLRDHNFQFRYPFEMLIYSRNTWSRWLDLDGGFHLKRRRVPDYLRAANEAGFVKIDYEVLLHDSASLQSVGTRLAPEFRCQPRELLTRQSVALRADRPH